MTEYNKPQTLSISPPRNSAKKKIYSSSEFISTKFPVYNHLQVLPTRPSKDSPHKQPNNQIYYSSKNQTIKQQEARFNLNLPPQFSSTRSSFTKCKSQRQIKHNQEINHLFNQERKIEIVRKQKESLDKWKIIRSMRKIQEKSDKKILEEELKERRRESYMENMLRKKREDEEKQFEHETKYEWIKTLKRQRLKSGSRDRKSLSKLNKSGSRKNKTHKTESKDGLNKSSDRFKSTYQSTNYDSHKFYSNLIK